MMPPPGGVHHIQAQLYGGLDAILLPLTPRFLRLRIVARKILRHYGNPTEVTPGSFTFSLPSESLIYEIVDTRGAVRPFKR